MALKSPSAFSIFAPKSPTPRHPRPRTTQIRFSQWNNANARKFVDRKRAQKEIEDDIRRERRFQSASRIAHSYDRTAASNTRLPEFKSTGTPSSPSLPSIPGKASKYSKPSQDPKTPPKPQSRRNPDSSHPAFRPVRRVSRVSVEDTTNAEKGIAVGENGLSYRFPNAPFEFQYSYTETPKAKPLALREAPFLPFGPDSMPRPWTGRKPLPGSKKVLPQFDSFRLPPPHKKGVKPVQAPGPFLAGSGPKYVMSREEILGEPLTKEEIKDLIRGCIKTKRQLNMGRDGLTHNMLDNIHAHWKRRRVCKIKCKGVCTVDMDNVQQQLEEKTGGKIIYSRGGVIFLFRGRNYNYRTRPRFPLMLWKPITPVYPRLVQRVPEGLTLEEATEMRKNGHKLPPICKLGKNGVYCDLVKNVREAFEECELVQVNCQGMNRSDYKKIGGKLKDLVPCVLLSFKHEHILMWRGRDWKSSLPKTDDIDASEAAATSDPLSTNLLEAADSSSVYDEISDLDVGNGSDVDDCFVEGSSGYDDADGDDDVDDDDVDVDDDDDVECAEVQDVMMSEGKEDLVPEGNKNIPLPEEENEQRAAAHLSHTAMDTNVSVSTSDRARSSVESTAIPDVSDRVIHNELVVASEDQQCLDEPAPTMLVAPKTETERLDAASEDQPGLDAATGSSESKSSVRSNQICMEGVLSLWRLATESGNALVLDDDSLDANIVYERAVAFAKTAPAGPVFRNSVSKVSVKRTVKQDTKEDLRAEEVGDIAEPEKRGGGLKKGSKNQRKDFKYEYPDVVPQGSLRVDELAKLLS